MEWGFISIILFGLLLGCKHAIEPDHVIAVSTIASQSRIWWRAALAGVYWGIGHTLTLLVVGVTLLLLKQEIPAGWQMSLEFAVGIMLVALGANSLYAYRRGGVHVHEHQHDGTVHRHFHTHREGELHEHRHSRRFFYIKSMLIGFVHGLAGSGAMLLLTMETVESVGQAAAYISVFGVGTVFGMLLCSTAIGLPFLLSSAKPAAQRGLTTVTGAVSTLFGVYYMYDLGVTQGLFRLWFS